MNPFAAFGMGMLEKLGTGLSDTYGTGDTLREHQRKDAQYDYLERERLGIQARVEGAKAAGLHPLVAMGYQSGNSPTAIIGGSELPRQDYRTQDRAEPDPNIDRYNAARARLAEAEATKAEMDLAASRHRLATQPGNGNPRLPTEPENMVPGPNRTLPGVRIVPNQIESSIGGKTVGTHPGATDVKIPGMGTITLPSAKLSEALEDVELLKYAAILAMNKGRISDYVTNDIPWAIRGVLGDYVKKVQKTLSYGREDGPPRYVKPRRSGGATGSW